MNSLFILWFSLNHFEMEQTFAFDMGTCILMRGSSKCRNRIHMYLIRVHLEFNLQILNAFSLNSKLEYLWGVQIIRQWFQLPKCWRLFNFYRGIVFQERISIIWGHNNKRLRNDFQRENPKQHELDWQRDQMRQDFTSSIIISLSSLPPFLTKRGRANIEPQNLWVHEFVQSLCT